MTTWGEGAWGLEGSVRQVLLTRAVTEERGWKGRHGTCC